MAAPTIKVELGLDLGLDDPTSLRLDDPVKGLLNSPDYPLGGPKFFDIGDRLISVSTNRGKSEALDRTDAGVASITLNNSDRLFDPLYEDGLYFGQLVPRREVRISANDQAVLYGFIEDFDISYEPGNRSFARIEVSDAFSILANNTLDEITPDSELAGARINRILDLPEVAWPADKREIDTGNTLLLDVSVDQDTGTLQYLQEVAASEFGSIFLSKDGKIVFRERNSIPNDVDLIFTDDDSLVGATLVPFVDLNVVYGSENLYNRISLQNADLIPEEVLVEDIESQALYGIRSYNQSGLLVQEPSDLVNLAELLLATYKDPQYRFEALSVVLDDLSEEYQAQVLDLEIGDLVQVRFTPSGIPPAIIQSCRIIGIGHNWSLDSKSVIFKLERLDFGIFVLDSEALGRLDVDRLGYE
jgi:hypothetical protein